MNDKTKINIVFQTLREELSYIIIAFDIKSAISMNIIPNEITKFKYERGNGSFLVVI